MLALPALALMLALAPEPADVRLGARAPYRPTSRRTPAASRSPSSHDSQRRRASPHAGPPRFLGRQRASVTDADNRPVKSTRFKGERKAVAKVMTLAPGEAKTHRYTDLTGWTCCYGYTFNPLPPGRYQITVTIKNPPVDVKPPAEWKPFWTGTVSARPLTITVR